MHDRQSDILRRFVFMFIGGWVCFAVHFSPVFFTVLSEITLCWAQGRECEGKNHREREVVTPLCSVPVSPLPKVLPLALPLSLPTPLCSNTLGFWN